MDGFLSLPRGQLADVQIFNVNSVAVGGFGVGTSVWRKRPGATMLSIVCIGGGGGGGQGNTGATASAGGGGGGGAGVVTTVSIPAIFVPDTLYVAVGSGGVQGAGTTNSSATGSRVAIAPGSTIANDTLANANGGNGAGNGGAGVGTGGTASSAATIATMCLAGRGVFQSFNGQAGTNGSVSTAGIALTLPVTGTFVTGGTGGGGLPAAAAVGTVGGSFTVAGIFPAQSGGVSAGAATTPGGNGSNGFQAIPNLMYFYGGTGGGSTHGSATGGGLVPGFGGAGGIGSGGGGGGGGLTGSSAGSGGRGGDGLVVIVAW